MRLELVFIPAIFALAVTAMLFIKPIEIRKTDLSAVFLYWPEAYRYAERGDPSAIQRITGLAICASSGVINAYPGLAYKALSLYCRFKP
ncbi:MAG: hypothetical protein ACO2PN_27050 [Pyrobaculum sp.]|jgi:hypothetical protein